MKSRRAFLVKPGKFEIREVDVKPGPTEVMVKVAVCGLCNWEQNHWKGIEGTCPQTLGHEWAGTVAEVGKDVKSLKPGDNVGVLPSVMEGFSDYAVAGEKDCIKLVPEVKPEEALGEPLTCVVNVVHTVLPEPGDYGVLIGCGPMGLWCAQLLKGSLLGAIIAVDVAKEKLAMAKKFGATHTVNPKDKDALKQIADITNGRMADFVIEGTGIPEVLPSAMTYLKQKRGRLAIMSSHERAGGEVDWRPVMGKGMIIYGAHPGISLDIRDDFRRAIALLNRGTFKMDGVISHKFPLAKVEEAFKTLENKPKDYIKGVVMPGLG